MKAVSYLRVSTASQGRSGLGIEAQRTAVEGLCRQRAWTLAVEFVEVESGKRSDRPVLIDALHQARMTGAILVIAKLDRLSRNAAFLLTLRDSGVRFMAADMPDANDLTIGVLAVIAQAERDAISRRTTEALRSIQVRLDEAGQHTSQRSGRTICRLGNPYGSRAFVRAGSSNGAATKTVKALADQRARDVAPILRSLATDGHRTLSEMSLEMNRRGILTARGGRWHPASVRNALRRIEALAPLSSEIGSR